MSSNVLADWKCNELGWWTADNLQIGVCKERDGKWHSYALQSDTVKNSPAFKTMRAAMADAEARHRAANVGLHRPSEAPHNQKG